MPIQRLAHATSISDRLNVLATQLKTRSRASLNDANHSLEYVMARFFNALLGWDFRDLNAEQQDFPAADIGDRARRIAMQVTIEEGSRKIRDTTNTAVEHALGNDFDQLIIFFLLAKKPKMPTRFVQLSSGPEIVCWDLADLLKRMNNLPDVNALATAAKVLDEELGTVTSANVSRSLHQLALNPAGQGFVGREDDLAKLRALNPGSGAMLTGLRGMGGIGKTALALVLAHEWAARFPDAQLFLDARGTQANPPSAADLLAKVIQTFLPTARLPEGEAELSSIYRSKDVLGGKKVLILLDNARDAAQAKPLIPPEGCALIVTSRHSFMLGTVKPHDVGSLPDAEAAELLREFHTALTDAEAADIVKLCAGLPLALRLAGAHVALDAAERGGTPNVAAYVKALRSGRLAKLDAGADDAVEVTISETLRLSEAQLPEAERGAWRNLGVFTASFDARAAEAIAGADETVLSRFVRGSLLEREGEDRFKLHDLAADYAREKLGSDAVATLRLAHARHYIASSYESQRLYEKGDVVGGLARFDRERAQIEAAYTFADKCGNETGAQLMIDLVNSVIYTGDLRFHPHQLITWAENQLRAARITNHRRAESGALGNLGTAYSASGDATKAAGFFEQALMVSRAIGDRQSEAYSLGNLGVAHKNLGDPRKAIEYYNQHFDIAREIGDLRGEANALANVGVLHKSLGDPRKAIECYQQALPIMRKIGDLRGASTTLCNIGVAHKNLGDLPTAIDFYNQALVLSRKIAHQRGESIALGNLGIAHEMLREPRRAIEYYEQCLVIDRKTGDRRGEGYTLWNFAISHDSLGEHPEAIACAKEALVILEAIKDPISATVRAKLAEWRGAS